MAVGSQHIQLDSLRCLWYVFHSHHPRMPHSLKSNNKIKKKIPRRGLFYCDPRLLKPFCFSNLAEHLQRLKALERIFFTYKKHPNPLTCSSRLWASSLHNPLDGSHTYLHNPPTWKRSRQKTNKQLYWLPRTNIRKLIFYDLQSDWLGQFWFLVSALRQLTNK